MLTIILIICFTITECMAKDNPRVCKFNEYVNVILLLMFVAVLLVLAFHGCISSMRNEDHLSVVQQQELISEPVTNQADSVAGNQ